MQKKITEVKFKENSKSYSFLTNIKINVGDNVIVDTNNGQAFGFVSNIKNFEEKDEMPSKSVVRIATPEDIKQHEININKNKNAISITEDLAKKNNLDIKVIDANYNFEGNKVIIEFLSDDRVDFRNLVKDLAQKLKARIELRQVGIRDKAKNVGGIGMCGRECCCVSHLKDFEKVSMKMAKIQGLALSPNKISGICGRLLCCLEYENEYYSETNKIAPKINSLVNTPDGKGDVVYVNLIKQVASVKIKNKDDTFTIKDYSFADISKTN